MKAASCGNWAPHKHNIKSWWGFDLTVACEWNPPTLLLQWWRGFTWEKTCLLMVRSASG